MKREPNLSKKIRTLLVLTVSMALGLGGAVAPVVAWVLRRQRQAGLMAGGKK